MFGLLPLLFALTIAELSVRMKEPLVPLATWSQLLIAVGASVAAWLVVGEIAARILATYSTRRRWVGRWDFCVQVLVLAWYTWVCVGWGWTQAKLGGFQFFLVALAPWVVMQAAHWWTLTVAVRRVSGHYWSRPGLVLQQFRFGVLPMLLILPFFDVGKVIAVRFDLENTWFAGEWGAVFGIVCAQAFMVLLLLLLPLVLLPLWGAQRMPASEMQALMLRACERLGVRIAGLMRWPMAGGRVYNAAVIGMLPRLRYVLFTDDLVRDLPQEQVMAVLGHELGHARHGHLWTYLLFATASVFVALLLRSYVAVLLMPYFQQILPGLGIVLSSDSVDFFAELAAAFLMIALIWRLVFGVLSRACERQADLAGAELVGDPQVMCDALKSVAQLSGHGEDEPSWRHYTIAQRVAFLQAVRQRPEIATWHHQIVRMMRHGLILIIIVLLLAMTYLFDSHRSPLVGDPQAVMTEWAAKDHELSEALQATERGDHLPLAVWLNRAEEEQRETFALLTHRQIITDIGVDADGDQRFDDRPLYRWRHRLMAFQDIVTGNRQLDLMLDNYLAYALVAGTAEPTPTDLTIAKGTLPRLIKHVTGDPDDHAVHDTIGCVYFALGDYAKAVESFEQVRKGFEKDNAREASAWFTSDKEKREQGKLRTHLQSLYSHRLDAARTNAARVAAGTAASDPGLLPLPRDLGQPRPEPSTPGKPSLDVEGKAP